MTAPRLEINLSKIHHNARTLVDKLAKRGISVTRVTKAVLGSPDIVNALLTAGVSSLGDARIENIEAMRRQHVSAPMILIRSPMLSQVDEVVRQADLSFNTELAVITHLSLAAQEAKLTHGVVLMIELGDLREGILPVDLQNTVRAVLRLPNIRFRGIGANLACHSGVSPNADNMSALSALAESVEANFGAIELVSGGNSANLNWALSGAKTGRINNLRLGESILLGCETLYRQPIEGLYTDAFTLVAEVIEAKIKPTRPWGHIAQTAFPSVSPVAYPHGNRLRAILALGHQDVDPSGLIVPAGLRVLGASGDHIIIDSDTDALVVGTEITFGLNYSALIRAMTSPFIAKVMQTTADGNALLQKTKDHPATLAQLDRAFAMANGTIV